MSRLLNVPDLRTEWLGDRESWDVPADSPLPQFTVGAEILRLRKNRRQLHQLPKGQGQPVLIMPGFLASDTSTLLLRRYLKQLGYRVRGWRRGTNLGFVKRQLPKHVNLVKRLADKRGQPIHMIGSSLGGFLAREVARELPNHVAQVITFGAPIVGGPKYTRAARFYRRAKINIDKFEQQVDERAVVPIEVPMTVIYSKCDGVVAWQACIDAVHDHAHHVEINVPHACMGVSPAVFRTIAEKLAELRAKPTVQGPEQRAAQAIRG